MPLDGQTLGHYHLQKVIGRGGMGEVYLAEDIRIGRQVAVKVVLTEPATYPDEQTTQETARLFQREMKAIAALDHPHILPLYDFGETLQDNILIAYMVMPYRHEGSLSDWLRKRDTNSLLSPEEVNYFISQAADALQDAHEHHLIHQDVKPSNFLVRNRQATPDRPDIFLVDFGVAKFTTATATASQSVRGTPAFMAPEQWDGEPVSATDQYALAVMAYQLLVGRPPFIGRMEKVMRQHFMATPQPPSNFKPHISPAIDAVILHALEKNPEARFATIAEFAHALEETLYHKDGSAPPVALEVESAVYQDTPEIESLDQTMPARKSAPIESTNTVPASAELVGSKLDTKDTLPSSIPEAYKDEVSIPSHPSNLYSKVKTLLIVGLALLIIISSTSIFFAIQSHTNPVNANILATANEATYQAFEANNTQTVATAKAQGAATVQANMSTATAQAIINATATFVAVNHYPYYMPGHGTPVLVDSLSHKGNWSNASNISFGGSCQFSKGNYVISQSQPNRFFYCGANQTFRDFAFEVQMKIIQGDCGGMLFRGDYSSGRFYYFRICQYGTYDLFKYPDFKGPDATLITSNSSSAIHGGQQSFNTIAVVINKNSIILYINQQQVYNVQDSSYTQGGVALFANDISNSTTVSFSNARVWTLQ